MKVCYKCKKIKPLEEFYNNKNRPDGKNAHCKKCHSVYRKKSYIKNKKKELKQVATYRKSQYIDTLCSYCEKKLKRYRTNVDENKNNFCNYICMRNFNKIGRNYFKKYIRFSKRRANYKKIEFNLTESYLRDIYKKQNKKCAVTNIPIYLLYFSEKDTLANSASLDRIDNEKGYIKGNVRFVCLGINYMKNRRADSEVFELLDKILEYYKK